MTMRMPRVPRTPIHLMNFFIIFSEMLMMNQDLNEGLYRLNDHDERVIPFLNKNSLIRIGGKTICIILEIVMARTDPHAECKIGFEVERKEV